MAGIEIKEVPLSTRLAPKKTGGGLKPETIREKAKIILKEYDADNYIVGLKRGLKYVKKFLVGKEAEGKKVTTNQAEKAIKDKVLAGDFDKELIEDYGKLKKAPKNGRKKRGRPRKSAKK